MKIQKPAHLKFAIAGLFLLVVLGFLLTGLAAEKTATLPDQPPAQTASKEGGVWRSVVALGLVLGGLMGANWYLKNRAMGKLGAKTARRLRVIEKYAIDQKRCLLLVALDDKELLVGVGNDQINVLHGSSSDEPDALSFDFSSEKCPAGAAL